jgi:hypothetical protein
LFRLGEKGKEVRALNNLKLENLKSGTQEIRNFTGFTLMSS